MSSLYSLPGLYFILSFYCATVFHKYGAVVTLVLLVLDVVLAEEINNMTLVLALLLWSVKATVFLPCVCGKEDGTPDQQLRISSILGADAIYRDAELWRGLV